MLLNIRAGLHTWVTYQPATEMTSQGVVMVGDKYKKFAEANQVIIEENEEASRRKQAVMALEQLVTWMCLHGSEGTKAAIEQISESNQGQKHC